MYRPIKLTLISAVFGLVAGAAYAEDAKPAPAPSVDLYTKADAAAVLNARLIALKTVIEPTAEQEKLWQPVEAAIRQIAKSSAERREEREKAGPPSDFLDVVDRIAGTEEIHAKELKSLVEAARPFVASLSEEQKRRIPPFLGLTDLPGVPQSSGTLWIFEEEQG